VPDAARIAQTAHTHTRTRKTAVASQKLWGSG
jgi:hypothetical protein